MSLSEIVTRMLGYQESKFSCFLGLMLDGLYFQELKTLLFE
ncbi:hypothetical protein MIDIC_470003 [Alphaproteobacteria bacterium]